MITLGTQLNIVAFALYCLLGIYIFRLDHRSSLNRIIFSNCVIFAVWALSFAVINSSLDMTAISRWYDISSIGWCLFSGTALHFNISLTGKLPVRKRWLLYALLYVPGLVFSMKEFTGVLAAADFRFVLFGYAEVPPPVSAWYAAFVLYQAGYVLAALVLLMRWRFSSKLLKEKKQAMTMFWVSVVSLILCFTTDIFLPGLGIFVLPSMSSILILIWAGGMIFAVRRYRLMTMTLDYASRHIVEVMYEMLILLDYRGRIDVLNQKAEKVLGLPAESIRNTMMEDYVVEKDVLREGIRAIIDQRRRNSQIAVNIIIGSGDIVPFELEASAHIDRFGDIVGVIITGHDISDKIQLIEEIKARREIEAALRRSEKDLLRRNEIIGQGIRDAMMFQQAMLPGERTLGDIGTISYLYEPVDDVGGDFCDFIRFRERDRIGIFISDVSGHGVKAAFITAMIKTVIMQAAGRTENPAELLRYINIVLNERTGGSIITAFYGIYDRSNRRLVFSNAGHNPPFLISGSGVSEIECESCLPLAAFPNEKLERFGKLYGNREIVIDPGTRVLFYTDGLSEARRTGSDGSFFLSGGLLPALSSNAAGPGDAFLSSVMEAARRFRGAKNFEDDVCMICLDVE